MWWLLFLLLPTEHGWPSVRGPYQTGHADQSALAEKWPPAGPPVLWSRSLGEGYSSFVVQDGKAATLYQTAAGQFAVCLDAATGETLWETSIGWPWERGRRYPGPRATPTWSGGKLYFAAADGLVGCLDGRNGRRLWQVHLQQDLGGELPGFGYCCSPTVEAGLVLQPMGGKNSAMIALDASSGAVRWRSGDEAGSYAPAMTISHRGRRLVIGSLENHVVCHELQSGKRLWSFPLSSGYDEHSCWPIWQEPLLWISGPFRKGGTLLELTDDPGEPVRVVRRKDPLANDLFSSVLSGGAVFGFDVMESQSSASRSTRGMFRCLELSTGKELWAAGNSRPMRESELPSTTGGDWPGHCSVVAADGKLVLVNDLGELLLLRDSRDRCEILCRTPVLSGELCWTQPALAAGRLYLRNQSRAVCLYLAPPAELPRGETQPLTLAAIKDQTPPESSLHWLGIQPGPELLPPDHQQLLNWNLASCGVLIVAFLSALLLSAMIPRLRQPKDLLLMTERLSLPMALVAQPLLVTLLPQHLLTWPLALHISFQLLVAGQSRSLPSVGSSRWLARSRLLVLISIAAAWVFLCRHVGLIFESAFACGFVGSLPFVLLSTPGPALTRRGLILRLLLLVVSFQCFFWTSAAIMLFRG